MATGSEVKETGGNKLKLPQKQLQQNAPWERLQKTPSYANYPLLTAGFTVAFNDMRPGFGQVGDRPVSGYPSMSVPTGGIQRLLTSTDMFTRDTGPLWRLY